MDKSVSEIGMTAFSENAYIEEIILPASVCWIEQGGFSGCIKLKTLEIPPKVSIIGFGTFEDCISLERVKISGGDTTIDDEAFIGGDHEVMIHRSK